MKIELEFFNKGDVPVGDSCEQNYLLKFNRVNYVVAYWCEENQAFCGREGQYYVYGDFVWARLSAD